MGYFSRGRSWLQQLFSCRDGRFRLRSLVVAVSWHLFTTPRQIIFWHIDDVYILRKLEAELKGLLERIWRLLSFEPLKEVSRYIVWLIPVTYWSYLVLLSYGKSFCFLTRRPPPRGRRRSCASVTNPQPQPSIISEFLSRYPASVRQPSRRLASESH
jgi:hypothetical protein